MRSAGETWGELSPPWQAAFDEAWDSWCAGCFGIGAVAVDDAGTIVARGRNRVLEQKSTPGVLADSFTAHAEMNVLAALPWRSTHGLHLYTTLEPCLMCASAIVMLQIGTVHFAAADEMFAGMNEVLESHDFVASRAPERRGPVDGHLPGQLERFARVLPLSFLAFWMGEQADSIRVARAQDPSLADLALTLAYDGRLVAVRDGNGTTADALAAVWDDLV